jgi:hypothetical protein
MKRKKKVVLIVVIAQVVAMTVTTVHLANQESIVVYLQVIVSTALTLDKAVSVKIQMTYREMEKITTANSRLIQWRMKWLIEHSTSHQLLWCIDSEVLRNPLERKARKRYASLKMTKVRQTDKQL